MRSCRRYIVSIDKAFQLTILLLSFHLGHMPCLNICHHLSGNSCFSILNPMSLHSYPRLKRKNFWHTWWKWK
ncbi:pyrophosphate--fructose 6-phosphate 1-phosphotransferase subunit alpha-like isoform X3 [Iris pallida]|uniref:Pyrophosphate--fructose 6-phosphate 1-phosphotransferase subunit alpha-like isoform X3 n=1 Tax=Iris pallida TaxID=29817 RepID=A0AAX6GWZ3_IRIPA|nr:pyrophosphate--fructose 6-phosphate 1-phosphotransferase subunit alpha-like isoform X3 [Iris pallida]